MLDRHSEEALKCWTLLPFAEIIDIDHTQLLPLGTVCVKLSQWRLQAGIKTLCLRVAHVHLTVLIYSSNTGPGRLVQLQFIHGKKHQTGKQVQVKMDYTQQWTTQNLKQSESNPKLTRQSAHWLHNALTTKSKWTLWEEKSWTFIYNTVSELRVGPSTSGWLSHSMVEGVWEIMKKV